MEYVYSGKGVQTSGGLVYSQASCFALYAGKAQPPLSAAVSRRPSTDSVFSTGSSASCSDLFSRRSSMQSSCATRAASLDVQTFSADVLAPLAPVTALHVLTSYENTAFDDDEDEGPFELRPPSFVMAQLTAASKTSPLRSVSAASVQPWSPTSPTTCHSPIMTSSCSSSIGSLLSSGSCGSPDNGSTCHGSRSSSGSSINSLKEQLGLLGHTHSTSAGLPHRTQAMFSFGRMRSLRLTEIMEEEQGVAASSMASASTTPAMSRSTSALMLCTDSSRRALDDDACVVLGDGTDSPGTSLWGGPGVTAPSSWDAPATEAPAAEAWGYVGEEEEDEVCLSCTPVQADPEQLSRLEPVAVPPVQSVYSLVTIWEQRVQASRASRDRTSMAAPSPDAAVHLSWPQRIGSGAVVLQRSIDSLGASREAVPADMPPDVDEAAAAAVYAQGGTAAADASRVALCDLDASSGSCTAFSCGPEISGSLSASASVSSMSVAALASHQISDILDSDAEGAMEAVSAAVAEAAGGAAAVGEVAGSASRQVAVKPSRHRRRMRLMRVPLMMLANLVVLPALHSKGLISSTGRVAGSIRAVSSTTVSSGSGMCAEGISSPYKHIV